MSSDNDDLSSCQSYIFYEVQSEVHSEVYNDSDKNLMFSLQTQLEQSAKLILTFFNEKSCALKAIENLQNEIQNLQTEMDDLKSREKENVDCVTKLKGEKDLISKLFEDEKSKFLNKIDNLEKECVVKEYEFLETIDQLKSQVSKLS